MLTIYKYRFEVDDRIAIEMPARAQILKVECQDGVPCMWAAVDTEAPRRLREFIILGTGHPAPPDVAAHVATFQQPPFVWHMFEAR